jgi:glycosyltransferase involved in cell wall biosynthesis
MAATPAFCFVYDMLFELFPECFDAGTGDRAREQKHRAIRSAHRVLCISENTKKDVVKILDIEPTKCDVVYLAGLRRTEEGNRGETELKKRPFFLYVGDYEAPYKNFEFLLDCLGQPGFSEFGEHELVVAAPDFPEASKLKRYHELLPDTRLTFLNRCDDKMLTDLYISCNALVVPSLYEGFGLPVVEALGCGTPVVCSNVSSLPEVGGETAYYFDPQSVAEFRAALERGVRDGRTREHVDRRVERASCFSWDRTARSFALAARKTAGSV